MYREALQEAEHGRGEPSRPIPSRSTVVSRSWRGCASRPSPEGRPREVSRYLRRLYAEHPTLPARFPDIDGAGRPGFPCVVRGPRAQRGGDPPRADPDLTALTASPSAGSSSGRAGGRLLHRRGRSGRGRTAHPRGRRARRPAALCAHLRSHSQPPRPSAQRGLRRSPRVRHQPDLRERGSAPHLQPRDGCVLPRRSLHGGPLVVGGSTGSRSATGPPWRSSTRSGSAATSSAPRSRRPPRFRC